MIKYKINPGFYYNLVIGTYIIPTDKINYIAKTLEFIFDDNLDEVPKYGIRINVGPRMRDINFSYDTEQERDDDFNALMPLGVDVDDSDPVEYLRRCSDAD